MRLLSSARLRNSSKVSAGLFAKFNQVKKRATAKYFPPAAAEVESTLAQKPQSVLHLFKKKLRSKKTTVREMFLHKTGKKTCYLYLE